MTTPLDTPDLDLAFEADSALPAALLKTAGPLADPLAGVELWHELLSAWLAQLTAELPAPLQAASYSLGLALVDDAEIADLNANWRHTPGPTDVLAFAAQEEAILEGTPPMPLPADLQEAEPLELGDIVISLETAARQAPEHDHTLPQELLFLASHGLLHLLGWDHPDDPSLAAMLRRQEQLLHSLKPLATATETSPTEPAPIRPGQLEERR